MAKKRSTRRKGFKAITLDEEWTLATLAASTLLSQGGGIASDIDLFAISMDVLCSMRGLTVGEGPIIIGIANSDYTDAEIEEYIENAARWTRADMIAMERSRRQIRKIGQFSGNFADEVLNDGKKIRVKLRYAIYEGQSVNFWAYNASDGTLTTGAEINIFGQIYTRLL